MDVRSTFLDVAVAARNLIASEEVAARWEQPSALREMAVGDVAAHLGRAVTTVAGYLDHPATDRSDPVDAVGYYMSFGDEIGHDVSTGLNKAVRVRAGETAAGGPGTVVSAVDAALAQLALRLETAPADLVIEVLGSVAIRLDDYLVTRLVELTVHIDDLASSVDVAAPPIDEGGFRIVIAALVDIARRRHGDVAVLRALARRERDPGGVIPVL